MRFLKQISAIFIAILLITFCGCSVADKDYGVSSDTAAMEEKQNGDVSLPEITSLDNKMAKYFDISCFDEENYADIYLDKKFEIKANFAKFDFSVPTTMEKIALGGWKLKSGSDYDENSLVYAKETVELDFVNEDNAVITALFYNSSNSSIRLSKCKIVKFRINNYYLNDANNYFPFNVNGISNTSVITDVIDILGTPSHFYKKTDNSYYFDYFLQKRDRRNKIRIYVDLEDDAVTAVEFSKYK